MSASTEKKNRKAAREAGTDKKLLAAQEAEKKRAKSRVRWILTAAALVVLFAFILFINLNSDMFYTKTNALTVGDRSYSPAEVNYYYANAYQNYVNNLTSTYGNYGPALVGLNTSQGISGLATQSCQLLEDGGTWRDYFLQMAEQNIVQNKTLTDYAKDNGITLSDEEIASQVDALFVGLDDYAKQQGFKNVDGFLSASFGPGVTMDVVRQSAMDSALANKVLSTVQEGFEYSQEELDEYYDSLNGSADYFDYAYYYVAAESVETEVTDENGETTTTSEPNDQTRTEARATAEAIVTAYKDGDDIEDPLERFRAAVSSQVEGAQVQELNRVTGSSLNPEFLSWAMEKRSLGDITTVADSTGNGWFVMLFQNHDDNTTNVVNVRHILINAEASEDGSFTEEALAAARARAEEILAEYKAGEQTEEAFAALAEQYSEDPGSNTNGGLYENIVPGQMVEEFDAFCFADHKSGDTAIVDANRGDYAGSHVMYFVGQGDTVRNLIARNSLSNTALQDWATQLLEGVEAVRGSGIKRVG